MGLGGLIGVGGNNSNNLGFAQSPFSETQEWQPFTADSQVNTPTPYTPPSGGSDWSHDEYGATMAKQSISPTVASPGTPSGFNVGQFAMNPRGYLLGQGIKGVQSLFGSSPAAASLTGAGTGVGAAAGAGAGAATEGTAELAGADAATDAAAMAGGAAGEEGVSSGLSALFA